MGAWTYCNKCDRPIGRPGLAQRMRGELECPDCHTDLSWIIGGDDDKEEAWELVEEALNTIESQEKRIGILEAGMKAILSGKIKIEGDK